jgi:anion-transporting  ArsA/GET3 family ATPase
MSNGKSPIDEFLLSAQVMIENSLSDPEVKAALAVYGYTEEKLTAGKTLYNEAAALQNAQKKEYGEQIAATTELNEIWETADQHYMKALKIARVAFQEKIKADRATMLYGSRKRSLSGWLEQTQAFYANILSDSDFMNALSQYGYSQEKLEQESSLLNDVAAKIFQQKKEMGEAQAATQTRDKKIDELAQWLSDLRAVAKVALAEDPQQLEKLGILARTSKASKSQKPAEKSQSTEAK